MTMPTARPSTPSFWKLQAIGWTGFYVAMAFSRMGRFPLAYMLSNKVLLTLLGVAASLALRPVLRRLVASGRSMTSIALASAVLSYALAAVWTGAFNVIQGAIDGAFWGDTNPVNSLGELLNGTVYHAFSLAAWAFLYVGIKHWTSLQLERERALKAESLATSARLEALRAQLNPHILFNTLNAISTLVVERRTEQAAEMIARLSDLLRATLRRDAAERVALAEELSLVGQYLEIEQARLEDRLVVTLDVEGDAYRALVPVMLLQPLVENAVRHGIAPSPGGGSLSIAARRLGGQLEIVVANTGPASRADDTAGSGVGLSIVRERLAVLYPGTHSFRAAPRAGGGFEARITLPYEAGAAPGATPAEEMAEAGVA